MGEKIPRGKLAEFYGYTTETLRRYKHGDEKQRRRLAALEEYYLKHKKEEVMKPPRDGHI